MEPSVFERIGVPVGMVMMLFYFLQRQEDRHRVDREQHAIELNEVRKNNEVRMQRAHDRANELTVRVLEVVQQNSKVIATLVTMWREDEGKIDDTG